MLTSIDVFDAAFHFADEMKKRREFYAKNTMPGRQYMVRTLVEN